MKIFSFVFGILASLFILTSCSNELELTAPWKDVPIVYGMLSPTDTAQYIRVERAFIDPKKSALSFTKNPDSIYYKNATVTLILLSTGQSYALDRVDGNLEGYERKSGIWAQAPNYLYKIKSDQINIIEGNDYQLVIDKGDNYTTTKTTTTMIGFPKIRLPENGDNISLNSNIYLNWEKSEGAELYDVTLIFRYKESLESDPNTFVDKSLKWAAGTSLSSKENPSNIEVYSFKGKDFFKYLKSEIPRKDVTRKFSSMEFIVTAGGQEIRKYFDITSANQGITGSETLLNYTNIPDGYGIFSSISKDIISDLGLTPKTTDSLLDGQYTKVLNFK